jgi:hypothetical protein
LGRHPTPIPSAQQLARNPRKLRSVILSPFDFTQKSPFELPPTAVDSGLAIWRIPGIVSVR